MGTFYRACSHRVISLAAILKPTRNWTKFVVFRQYVRTHGRAHVRHVRPPFWNGGDIANFYDNLVPITIFPNEKYKTGNLKLDGQQFQGLFKAYMKGYKLHNINTAKCFWHIGYTDSGTLVTSYQGLTYPNLSYGLNLWSACASNKSLRASRFQKKVIRIIAKKCKRFLSTRTYKLETIGSTKSLYFRDYFKLYSKRALTRGRDTHGR